MSTRRRIPGGGTTLGILGGVLGAAATGAAVGVAARASRLGRERRETSRPDPAELGVLPPGRPCSVTADDGIRLDADVLEPDGEPALTLVFVHGLALDRRSWHFQRHALSARRDPALRLVLYDQRGHGRSERGPRDTATIDQLGDDLDAVLRTLAPDGPVVLVGHSMGGMAVMALAQRHPELFGDRVTGVALLCTSAGEVGSSGLPGTFLSRRNVLTRSVGVLAGWQPGLVERARALVGDLVWGVTRAYSYGDRAVASWLVDFVHAMISANAVDALVDYVDTLNTHDRLAALPALTGVEVLVVCGESDRVIPARHSEVIAAELPESTLMPLAGTGHLAMLERPAAVDAALIELATRAARRAPAGLPATGGADRGGRRSRRPPRPSATVAADRGGRRSRPGEPG